MTKPTILVAVVALLLGAPAFADDFSMGFLPDGPEITEADITAAQKMWGDAVVAIGAAGDKAPAVAEEAARTAYAFDLGPIQFKPTLASVAPFRPDMEGTLSYFVSGNNKFAEDKGFALRPWSNVRFDNHTIKVQGNIAIAMGHYYFTGPDGTETKVEYTKCYVKTPDGRVLLFLQDSSLPSSPCSRSSAQGFGSRSVRHRPWPCRLLSKPPRRFVERKREQNLKRQ